MLCITGGVGAATSGGGVFVINNWGLLENAKPVTFPKVTAVFFSEVFYRQKLCVI